MRRLLLSTALVAVLCGVTVLLISYSLAKRNARRAETLLTDLQTLRPKANQQDAERFVAAHASSGTKEIKCIDTERTNCDFVIRIDNRWLARLHLVPPTNFGVGFSCSGARVVRMESSIGVHRVIPGTFTTIYAADVTEQVYDPEVAEPVHSIHKLAHNAPGVFIPWFVSQRVDERATEQQRKAAILHSISLAYTNSARTRRRWHRQLGPPQIKQVGLTTDENRRFHSKCDAEDWSKFDVSLWKWPEV